MERLEEVGIWIRGLEEKWRVRFGLWRFDKGMDASGDLVNMVNLMIIVSYCILEISD